MMHELALELHAGLRARGVPFPVVDGPEMGRSISYARERIVLEHGDADTFAAAPSQRTNRKIYALRVTSATLTIYAKSPRSGALPFEHRERAERVLDHVIIVLDRIGRRRMLTLSAGRWITPQDLEDSERPAGAAYELSFTVGRAVEDLTWAGDAKPEITLAPGLITSTTKVSLAHGPDNDADPTTVPVTAETACGG